MKQLFVFIILLMLPLNLLSEENFRTGATDIIWEYSYSKALIRAKKENKPIFYLAYSPRSRESYSNFISRLPGVKVQLSRFVPALIMTKFGTKQWWKLWAFLNRAGHRGGVAFPAVFVLSPEGEVISYKNRAGRGLDLFLSKAAYKYESGAFAKREKINWINSLTRGLEIAKGKKRPVFLYISLKNCGVCSSIEGTLFKKSEIIKLSKSFISIKTMYRHKGVYRYMVRKLWELGYNKGRYGFPFVLLLTSEGVPLDYAMGGIELKKLAFKMRKILKK